MWRETLAGDRAAQDADCRCPRGARGHQIVLRVSNNGDFGWWEPGKLREGKDRGRIGLVTVAGIVGSDEFEELVEPKLAELRAGVRVGIVGHQAEPVAPHPKPFEQRRYVTHRRQM